MKTFFNSNYNKNIVATYKNALVQGVHAEHVQIRYIGEDYVDNLGAPTGACHKI